MFKCFIILFILIFSKNIYCNNTDENGIIFPSFIGGDSALQKYLIPFFNYNDNLFPNNEPIKANFDILEDGSVNNIRFEKSYYNKIFMDSIKVALSKMPKWQPAMQFDKPLKYSYYLTFFNRNRIQPTHPSFIFEAKFKNNLDTLNKEPVISTRLEVMPSFRCESDRINQFNFSNTTFTCLNEHINSNLVYPYPLPENYEGGKVIVNFYVDIDGSIKNPKVVKNPLIDERFANAALDVVKSMPAWLPGKQNGVPARCYYTLPITFLKK